MSATAEVIMRVMPVLAGPAMGSFAALLADRLPRGEPVVWTRSRCRSCGATLDWYDVVPIVSWVALRGRCRHCGASVPSVLPQAELVGLGLGVGAALMAPTPLAAIAGALFLWCLLALALADLRFYRLPDVLTGARVVLGLGLAMAGDGSGWPEPLDRLTGALLGAAIGSGFFWLLRTGYRLATGRDGMGLGDVKLMAGIGAGLGAAALPMVTLVAGVSALAVAGMRARRRGRGLRRDGRVPFGAFLALGAAAVWLTGLAI